MGNFLFVGDKEIHYQELPSVSIIGGNISAIINQPLTEVINVVIDDPIKIEINDLNVTIH